MSGFYDSKTGGSHAGGYAVNHQSVDDNDIPINDDPYADYKDHGASSFDYSNSDHFENSTRDQYEESVFKSFTPDNVMNMDEGRVKFESNAENRSFFAKPIGRLWLINSRYDMGWHAFVIYRSFLWFEPYHKSGNLKAYCDDLIKAINQGTVDSKKVRNILLDPTTSVEISAKNNLVVTVSNSADSVEIKFDSSYDAELWSCGLKSTSSDNFFTGVSTQIFREKLNILVQGYLYKSTSRNDAMNRFCCNLRDESGSSGPKIVFTSAYHFLKQVVDKTELGVEDVYAFANLLVALSTNLYLRVLITLLNVAPGMIRNFVRSPQLVSAEIANNFAISRSRKDGINGDVDYLVNYLIHKTNELSQPPTHLDFEVLLRIVRHPHQLLNNQLNMRNDNREVSDLELQWISDIKMRLKIFIVDNYDIFDIEHMFNSKGLSLLFSICDRMLGDHNADDNVVHYLIKNLRKDYPHKLFVARVGSIYFTDAVIKEGVDKKKHCFLETRHFLSLLCRVKESCMVYYFDYLLQSKINNDDFKCIIRMGLRESKLCEFLEYMFYGRFGSNSGYICENLSTVPLACNILLEELVNFSTEPYNTDGFKDCPKIRKVLSYMLRLENVGNVKKRCNLSKCQCKSKSDYCPNMGSIESFQKYIFPLDTRKQKLITDLLKKSAFLTEFLLPLLRMKAARFGSYLSRLPSAPGDTSEYGEYHKVDAQEMLYGFFKLCLLCRLNFFHEFATKMNDTTNEFQDNLVHMEENSIRLRIINALCDRSAGGFDITRDLREKMLSGAILREPKHYNMSALATCSYSGIHMKEQDHTGLVVVALKLDDYRLMNQRVIALDSWCKDVPSAVTGFKMILKNVESRPAAELKRLSLEDIRDCAMLIVRAKKILSSGTASRTLITGTQCLEALFSHYINNMTPGAWKEAFKGAESIAMFLKYLNREDVDKAYSAFAHVNRNNTSFGSLLESSRAVFNSPIVSGTEFEQLVSSDAAKMSSMDTNVADFIQNLQARGASKADDDSKFLHRITAAWMAKMYAEVKVPMAPRNVQIITVLVIIKWYESRNQVNLLLAQVGTGEGKSLIICMLAIYFVIHKNMRVHIMVNNLGLLQKDYKNLANIYGAPEFRIELAMSERGNEPFSSAQNSVTYCTRGALESYYSQGIMKKQKPFENTILIVDEVDDLIVSEEPNQTYVKPDSDNDKFKRYLDLLGTDSNARCPSKDPLDTWVWDRTKDAFLHRNRRKSTEINGKFYGFDGRGNVDLVHYYLELEAKGYLERKFEPRLLTEYYQLSVPHMFGQYGTIIGLSGSLGSPAELKFLNETYKTFALTVPSFLDTCHNTQKKAPALIDECIYLESNQTSQFSRIADVAIDKCKKVPVLVILKNATAVKELQKSILRKLKPRKEGMDSRYVQIFLERDEHGNKMDYGLIMSKAVEKVHEEDSTSVVGTTFPACYTITITDWFGGRGHDYITYDEDVEENGGVLVIVGSIPPNEREHIQWRGRTARSDRSGSIAYILDKTENQSEIFNKLPQELLSNRRLKVDGVGFGLATDTRYAAEIMQDIMTLQDSTVDNKLLGLKVKIRKGKIINEFCDHFYKRCGEGEPWPGTDKHRHLRNFINESWRDDEQAIISKIRGLYQTVGFLEKSQYF